MLPGFIPVEAAKAPAGLLPKCGACKLDKACKSPKIPVTGRGDRGILIVSEAPGAMEDASGCYCAGKGGRYLRQALRDNGVDLDRDCWMTAALICRPPERAPTSDEIDYCRPNLLRTIRELQPSHIIPLGSSAVESLIAPLWREKVGAIEKWSGWKIPLQEYNAWITPLASPDDVLGVANDQNGPVVQIWFERYLAQAVKLHGRPWEKVPDYQAEIRIIMDPEAAAKWIDEKLATDGVFSLDYETDRLKPDHPEAAIVCASVCWAVKGARETIAFPWAGAAIPAMQRLLLSGHPKIGANNKFESRWTMRFFDAPVNNFVHDITIVAHVLDNRKDITSLKFQAFVRLGVPDWSYSINQYLDADGGNDRNRIREADLRRLLLYNGLDSLLCYLVACHQREEIKNAEIGTSVAR